MKEPTKGIVLPQPFWATFFIALFSAIILIAVVFDKVDEMDQRIEWIRLIGFIGTPFVVAVGLYFTKEALEVNRGVLAQTAKSVENASKQLMLESRTKTEELFYKASTELSSDSEHSRIAALYTLKGLAVENREMLDRSIDVISAFMRTRSVELSIGIPTEEEELKRYRVTEDMIIAASHLGTLLKDVWRLVNLDGVNFSGLTLRGIDLSRATMKGAVMIGTRVVGSVLTDVNMSDSTIINTKFKGSDLSGLTLRDSNLNQVTFDGCHMIHTAEQGARLSEVLVHVDSFHYDEELKNHDEDWFDYGQSDIDSLVEEGNVIEAFWWAGLLALHEKSISHFEGYSRLIDFDPAQDIVPNARSVEYDEPYYDDPALWS